MKVSLLLNSRYPLASESRFFTTCFTAIALGIIFLATPLKGWGQTLTQITVDGTNFSLSFQSQASFIYSLQYKNSLTDPSWAELQPIVADGGLTTMVDLDAIPATRFYRIVNTGSAAQSLVYIPPGSLVVTNEDDSLSITPPNGYTYVGHDTNNNFLEIASGGISVSCTCSKGSGCSPGTSGKKAGCFLQSTCTACSINQVTTSGNVVLAEGGYLNMSQPLVFIDQTVQLPGPFPAMFQSPEVTNAITTFLAGIYTNGTVPQLVHTNNSVVAPDGFSFAVVNVFGRAISMAVPDSALPAYAIAGKEAKCSGCSTCKPDTEGYGQILTCEPGCAQGVACTLSTSIAQIHGNTNFTIAYQTLNYAY